MSPLQTSTLTLTLREVKPLYGAVRAANKQIFQDPNTISKKGLLKVLQLQNNRHRISDTFSGIRIFNTRLTKLKRPQKIFANHDPPISMIAIGFFVLNPILSDLATLCELGLWNLEKNVTPSGNRTWASDYPLISPTLSFLHYPFYTIPFYTNLSCAT